MEFIRAALAGKTPWTDHLSVIGKWSIERSDSRTTTLPNNILGLTFNLKARKDKGTHFSTMFFCFKIWWTSVAVAGP